MDWAAWAPLYAQIRADLGYDIIEDERARDLADVLLRDKPVVAMGALRDAIAGREVFVLGGAATPADLARLPDGAPMLMTDGAAGEMMPWRAPLAVVSDLDGDITAQVIGNALGIPIFLHAHGDNTETLRLHLPRFVGPVQGTTQVETRGRMRCFGGFTDGDRACCLAVELGATSLALVGFDFEHPIAKLGSDPGVKRRKLAWARRIIGGLGVPVRLS